MIGTENQLNAFFLNDGNIDFQWFIPKIAQKYFSLEMENPIFLSQRGLTGVG